MSAELVLVTGPPRAGVTAMAAALRGRMPAHRFAESSEMDGSDVPAAVVFVVSAVAPITESDCALADFAAAETDAVIAVVAKVDDHRDWRRVLAADRALLACHAPRFADVPWLGAAAAPRLGEPRMDELVEALERRLRDPARAERNALRACASRTALLRDRRESLLRQRRLATSDHATTLRGAIQRARLAVTHTSRQRCASLRAELLDEAVSVGWRDRAGFVDGTRARCDDLLAEVDIDIDAQTGEMAAAAGVGPVVTPAPAPVGVADVPLTMRRLETRLMAVLGVGFGVGVALVVTRVLAGVMPDRSAAALAAGAAAGVAIAAWVIRARALLQHRALLQSWVGDVAVVLRAAVDERVAARMLAAESAIVAAGSAARAAEDAEIGRRIAEIEAELRQISTGRGPRSHTDSLLPIGRSPGYGHLNRSCE